MEPGLHFYINVLRSMIPALCLHGQTDGVQVNIVAATLTALIDQEEQREFSLII